MFRYTKEQQEQRDIADQQEELLLRGTSARFLNRRPNSPEFAATIIAGSSKDPSSPEYFRRPNNVPSGISVSPNLYNPTLGFDPVLSNQQSPTPGFHEDFRWWRLFWKIKNKKVTLVFYLFAWLDRANFRNENVSCISLVLNQCSATN